MEIVLSLIGVLSYVVAVLLVALRVPQTQLSEFELRRREKLGDPQAVFGLKRQAAYRDVMIARWLTTLILALIFVLCMQAALHGWRAITVIIIALIAAGPLARLGLARRLGQRIYRHYEAVVMYHVHKMTKVWQIMAPPLAAPSQVAPPASREELAHLIEASKDSISHDELQLLHAALKFYETTAQQVMTNVDDFVTIPAEEVAGPLVIHDLHETGYTTFPVVDKSHEYIGLFDISRFTSLQYHDSPVVQDSMNGDVMRVRNDEPLDEVLRLFVDAKQTCMFVVDDEERIVGMMSLSDIVCALTGWQRHPGR